MANDTDNKVLCVTCKKCHIGGRSAISLYKKRTT